MTNELSERDLGWIVERLSTEPEYRRLVLRDRSSLDALARYRPGDLIRVPRTGGGFSLGVVVECLPGFRMTIGVQSQRSSRLSLKEVDGRTMLAANPLKIGDYIELDGVGFWVSGLDTEGRLVVLTESGNRIDPEELRDRVERYLSTLEGEETLKLSVEEALGREESTLVAPTRPLSLVRPLDKSAYVPIESILTGDSIHGLVAGSRETDTVFALRSPLAGAALHTDRGCNYKSWNEDGGALLADRSGRIYFGVFDQAGGEGSDESHRGAASAVAAQVFFDHMQRSAIADHDPEEIERVLVEAALRAHEAILNRGKGEVTTYVAGRLAGDQAIVANVGDSGALHFSRDGRLLHETRAQGLGNILLEGLGILRKEKPNAECYRWRLSAGDHLVVGSDGLMDTRLPKEEIGRLVASAPSAPEATRRLRDTVRDRMRTREGKPDNLTVIVIRVGEAT